jgi:3-methyladenine DNA glycosylase AlkD
VQEVIRYPAIEQGGRMKHRQVMRKLKALGSPENVAGMARFGIQPRSAYGVSAPAIRQLAIQIGTDHRLAQQLWRSGNHDARGLAALIDDHWQVTEEQMENWAKDFDSWAVVDGACNNLFRKTALAHRKAIEWAAREEEFVKRAGFTMMACLAVHDKRTPDAQFLRFLAIVRRKSTDDRNFVRKAVNWALRQIGKRNLQLRQAAIRTAKQIQRLDSKAARWIAADALRELNSKKTVAMIRGRAARR